MNQQPASSTGSVFIYLGTISAFIKKEDFFATKNRSARPFLFLFLDLFLKTSSFSIRSDKSSFDDRSIMKIMIKEEEHT